MRPKHSQTITISDDTRANVAMVPALVVGLVLVLGFGFDPLGTEADATDLADLTERLISIFLVTWPLFAFVYLLWTHAGLNELDETELIVHSRWALARKRTSWARYFTMGGAVSWAAVAAYLAVILNVFLVTMGSGASVSLAVILGLANVVASWAVMVYSFALEYMRLDLGGGGSAHARQLEFDMPEERAFGDYLTFSVLSSTMTAALPGKATTRPGWRLVRTNVILAFVFNSVVVATLVSMFLSYIPT
ncbi:MULTISPECIES: DUF1345 domain-containing protein [unclassified Brevibacterium]|uniref:DUF1345 domain-containing protein n=1 Tax=unclassified Brevibacterium TaxID=2614124 RepID=UPI001E552573|nr:MULTISPECIES: DUF1345 domain-containing protein [unclassified Brevibacterium]MCD1287754.1 DUF1345 domain-containing protein [Brevibacterium sp. CCUG 69071]MDK8433357.1 DUF1345 domain-containing protein [Brevibacterium sp. H-BE7]